MAIRLTSFLAAATISGLLAADSTALQRAPQAPILGWINSSATGLQPVKGLPGAVVLGDALTLPDGSGKAAVAPGQQFAIVENPSGAGSSLLAPGAGKVEIPGSTPNWDKAAFSASGLTAVLLSGHSAQVIGSLNSQPSVLRTVDLNLDAPVTAIAVSDDGSVAAATSDGTAGSIWLLTAGQDPARLTAAGNVSALRFLAGNRSLVVADAGTQQVAIVGSDPRVIAAAAQGISAPSDVQVSASGKVFWIADTGANALFTVDTDSGSVSSTPSPYAPASLRRLDGDSVFLVSSPAGDQFGIWTPKGANTQVWRLPVANPVE